MTPHLRIAADLRRRIESGELVPGARVPSTRELATRWKVATATAAHALRLLTNEGLVHAKPRSGTVVSGVRPRTSAPGHGELSRERVTAAALEIADAEGLAALSIRGLAARLDTSAMSLYRHVRNKHELITLMTDAALGEEALPATPPHGWRAQLELGARHEWRIFKRHPWLARVVHISRPSPMPNALALADWVMRALDGSALRAPAKLQVHVVLHSFIQGLAVNLEAEAQAIGDTGITEEDHMRMNEAKFAALADSGRFPYFAKMMHGISSSFELDIDALFELGLARLLDGFTPLVEGRARRRT
ncbi:MAG: GntR family transcriptional regulator [Kofleriaceae bacterium]|nr:GntR family transcriptional regulator [Kofleriaceae bacterium]